MPAAFQLAQRLRVGDIRTELEYTGRSLKAQMKTANKLNARYVVILGEDEIREDTATVRDMETGDQQSIPFDRISR